MLRFWKARGLAVLVGLASLAGAPLGAQTSLLRQDGQLETGVSFVLTLQAGQRLGLQAASLDFEPVLELTFSDGAAWRSEGTGPLARLSGFVPAAGLATLRLQAQGPGAQGTYSLRVSEQRPRGALQAGQPLSGRLVSGTSETAENDRLVEWYTLQVQAGQRYDIRLQSDFDNFLYLKVPATGEELSNDDADGMNAGLIWRASQDGVVWLGASSYSGGQSGEFRLSAEVLPPPQPLRVGQPVQGRLGSGASDRLFEITGAAPGSRLIATLESDDFDPRLTLTQPGQESVTNDDDGESRNSRLAFTLGRTGPAELQVSAAGAASGTPGRFTLRLENAPPLVSLSPNQAFNGDLADGARLGDKQGLEFALTGRAGEAYVLTLESEAFDPFLRVLWEDGRSQENDDNGENYNSRLEVFFESDSTLTVQALAYGSDVGSGAFRLLAEALVLDPPLRRMSAQQPLGLGETLRGYLGAASPRDSEGRPIQVFRVDHQGPRVGIVTTDAPNFDAFFWVQNPDGTTLELDDGPDGLNPVLEMTQSGVYLITLRPYAEQGSGLYTISYRQGAERISLGEWTGTTGPGGPRDISGRWFQSHTLRLRADQRVIFSLEGDFDTFLILQNDRGDKLAEDDDGGNGLNSRLDYTAPSAGLYTLVVTGAGEAAGAYTLRAFEER